MRVLTSVLIALFILVCVEVNAQSIQGNNSPLPFLDCSINFLPSLTLQDIQKFNDNQGEGCVDLFEVDKALKTDQIDFRKDLRYTSVYNFRPSIQDAFSSPSFRLGDYDDFQSGFRFSNPAFFEANRNTVISQGYQMFVPSTGGTDF